MQQHRQHALLPSPALAGKLAQLGNQVGACQHTEPSTHQHVRRPGLAARTGPGSQPASTLQKVLGKALGAFAVQPLPIGGAQHRHKSQVGAAWPHKAVHKDLHRGKNASWREREWQNAGREMPAGLGSLCRALVPCYQHRPGMLRASGHHTCAAKLRAGEAGRTAPISRSGLRARGVAHRVGRDEAHDVLPHRGR